MADWYIAFWNAEIGQEILLGEYSMMAPRVEVRNSEPGGFECELALSHKDRIVLTQGITRDQFAPYRTNYQIYRQSSGNGVCISDGMVTSINLKFNRDTVLVSGKDWKHYLQRRIYPFSPADYVNISLDADKRPHGWDKWPKQWPTGETGDENPIPINEIVRDILASMRTGLPLDSRSTGAELNSPRADGVPHIVWNLPMMTSTTKYKIYPGDQTSIYDHITKLSELARDKGFEWDITPISLEFKLWEGHRFPNEIPPVYWFRLLPNPADPTDESAGAFIDFDWTNEGPAATYLIGLGTREHKVGQVWTDADNVRIFGRHDLVYDYGALTDDQFILDKLKDQNDLHPQKKLSLQLLNPEFLTPNFYTGGRPRQVIGNSVRVTRDFDPLHKVDAYFRVNGITWDVDSSTNEIVTLDLMMEYEPSDGTSGGIREDLPHGV